jgi:hypothetical protein
LSGRGYFSYVETSTGSTRRAGKCRDITGKGEAAAFDGRGECYVETGDGLTAYGEGKFYGDPVPEVILHPPAPEWHEAKIRYEKEWLEADIRSDEDFRRTA